MAIRHGSSAIKRSEKAGRRRAKAKAIRVLRKSKKNRHAE